MKWLLFLYSVPSKPVSNRMKIWRRLTQAGAVPFKGAAYILPYNEEHYELCQWLVSEVISMGGEAAFLRLEKIETMKDNEIIELFNRHRMNDYKDIEKRLEEIENRIQSIIKGSGIKDQKKLTDRFHKLSKEFDAIRKIDFFSSKTGTILKKRLETLSLELKKITPSSKDTEVSKIIPRQTKDYRGKTWVTRRKPFVDRMASAWLIKKFIDPEASFEFINENEIAQTNRNTVTFDIMGGEFTHIGDMCTFEVLMKSFNLSDRRIKKISEIVHEIDIRDEKFKTPEARGIENILKGIRKTSKDDTDALERGMAIFELLYESMS